MWHRWAARFLFTSEQLNQPVGRLSGGERARVLIAKLMLEPADVLLLDEPTNDLDIPTLEILEENLLEFRWGAGAGDARSVPAGPGVQRGAGAGRERRIADLCGLSAMGGVVRGSPKSGRPGRKGGRSRQLLRRRRL